MPVVILTGFFVLVAGGVGGAETASSEIRVGSELEFAPYAFVDEHGKPAGFSVDLIKAVAGEMGLSIKITTGPWDTVWKDLVEGRLDVLPLVAKMPARRRLVDFGLSHTETFDAFFVRRGTDPLKDIESARGKEIVVMRSDAAHHALLERNFKGKLILVDTIPEGLSLVSSGKHYALLCSKLIGSLELKKLKIKGINAGPPIPDYKRVFSFAVKKGDTELLEKLNQGLMIIKTNGEYERLYEKWLTVDDPWRMIEKYLLPAGIIIMGIALFAGIWVVTLKLQVRKRTRELAEINAMLGQAREELEARVAQRTNELTQSNRALQSEITERKLGEERTKHLASFPHLNPNPVLETDSSGKIIYLNPGAQNLLEGLGMDRNQADVFLPSDFRGILRELENKEEETYDREIIIKDRVYSSTVHIAPQFNVVRIYAHDITERKKVEAANIRASEEWELTFNSVPDLIAILDRDYRIIRVNRAMAEKLGTSADKCIGLKCFACVHGTSVPPEFCPHTLSMQDGKEHSVEVHEDRFDSDYLVTTTPLFDEKAEIMGSVHVARDITHHKRTENQIKAALDEKELLLREIHHRVKNNMTVIFSMLKLQSTRVNDERDRELFNDSMDRIKSMALIHEKLYRSKNMAEINFTNYLRELTDRIFMTYKIPSGKITLKTEGDNVSLGIDTAIPCGLIVNELLSNAMKHAFPNDATGEIRVSLREVPREKSQNADADNAGLRDTKSEIELIVGDDGIGLPEKTDIKKSGTLGLNLLEALVRQIHGTMEVGREHGTEIRIRFKK